MPGKGKRNVYFPQDLRDAIDAAGDDFNLSRVCQDAVRAVLSSGACREEPRLVVKRDGVHLKCNACGFDMTLGVSAPVNGVLAAYEQHKLRRPTAPEEILEPVPT